MCCRPYIGNQSSSQHTGMVLRPPWRLQRLIVEHSIIIIVLAVGLPVVLTWAGYMPLLPALLNKAKPYVVWPSLISTYQVRPLPFSIGNAPTVGQGIYIVVFLIVNIVLMGVNYE